MLPNVEHGRDLGLDETSSGESEDLSDTLEGRSIMSVSFGFTRGVAGFCILSDSIGTEYYLDVTIGGSFERRKAKIGLPSRPEMADGIGKGAT